jgi:hypothetical protein
VQPTDCKSLVGFRVWQREGRRRIEREGTAHRQGLVRSGCREAIRAACANDERRRNRCACRGSITEGLLTVGKLGFCAGQA